jgi:hypothetical protein
MAGVQVRNGSYRYNFRFDGKQYFVTLGEVSEEEARSKVCQLNYLLLRLTQRLIQVPPDIGIVEFIQNDGSPPIAAAGNGTVSKDLTLAAFYERYRVVPRRRG